MSSHIGDANKKALATVGGIVIDAELVEPGMGIAEFRPFAERQLIASTPEAPGIDLEQFRIAVQAYQYRQQEFGSIAGIAEGRRLMALIDASPKGGDSAITDSTRLDFIAGEFLHIESVEIRASEDDADVGWVISQYHMGIGLVELIRWDDDNLRSAIDAAMQATSAEVGA